MPPHVAKLFKIDYSYVTSGPNPLQFKFSSFIFILQARGTGGGAPGSDTGPASHGMCSGEYPPLVTRDL